jgi:hypothetical protein
MPLDIGDVIARAKLPEKTLSLCLRGDLQAEWEDLERQLKAEQDGTDDDSLAGSPKVRELADRMGELGKEMAASEVVFRFRGLPAKKYSDLLLKNKAPEGEETAEGLNWSTWPTALIAAAATDPVMTYEQVEELSQVVTARQWDDLYMAAVSTNTEKISVPFSYAASAIRANTGPSSKQPAPSVSPAAGSSDESLFNALDLSTTKTGG